ncbi:MAG: 4Fe-4S dicluster domain-containing protein [Promethearchaeota archaeon]
MRYLKLPNQNVYTFLEKLRSHGEFFGPIKISEKFYDFREVEDVSSVELHYNRTITPPRKYFHPPQEKMFFFNRENVELQDIFQPTTKKIVLFGLHHCDIVGLRIIDTRFIDDQPDPYYLQRRKNGIIIGLSCLPDEYCFCNVRRVDFVDIGFDLFLHEVPDGFLLRVGSVRGHKIVDPIEELFQKVSKSDVVNLTLFEQKRESLFTLKGNWDNLRYLLELKADHSLWSRESESCVGCGNCTLVCPTCRCYDVKDIPSLDGKTGERIRFWDSCQYRSHGLVAGNHNFRETKIDRFENRYMCKNAYCKELTTAYCVGCGRCTFFCPTGINYKENLVEIRSSIEDVH